MDKTCNNCGLKAKWSADECPRCGGTEFTDIKSYPKMATDPRAYIEYVMEQCDSVIVSEYPCVHHGDHNMVYPAMRFREYGQRMTTFPRCPEEIWHYSKGIKVSKEKLMEEVAAESGEVVVEDMFDSIYSKLSAPFEDSSAYVVDESRGKKVRLIGVKGAYVIERLTKVFGVLGHGWRFGFSDFSMASDKEVLVTVVLQYRVPEDGNPMYIWNKDHGRFLPEEAEHPRVWSAPIFSVGGDNVKGGTVGHTDSQKGAVTAALSKAAGYLGVAVDAYKGKLVAGDDGKVTYYNEEEAEALDAQDLSLINDLLMELTKIAPEVVQSMSDREPVAQFINALMIETANYIREHGLVEFVTSNLPSIVGEDKHKVSQLTMRELLFLRGLVGAIGSGGIDADTALLVAQGWDKESRWSEISVKEKDE